MDRCIDCGSKLIEIDFSKSKADYKHNTKKHGRAFKCKKCNIVFFNAKTSRQVKNELEKAPKDKLIKVDKSIWEEVHAFVSKRKRDYPSIKFFAQRALVEKILRETGGS